MKRVSPKRRGLMQLLLDSSHNWTYFPGLSSFELAKYELTVWNRATITWAEKAGLIETKEYGQWGRITEAGKELLDKLSESSAETLNQPNDVI